MESTNSKIKSGPENSQKQCFSYVRFSSKQQAKGDSLRRQLEIAPRVANEKGWSLRDDLCAENLGFSAYKGSNLETINGIIKAAHEGKIPQGTVMIIEALDRLTRLNLDDALMLFRDVLKAGIEIYTDKTGRHMTQTDLNNPMSLMMTVVELDAGFQYSDKISERTGKAWRQKKSKAAEGIVLTRMAPAWLDVDKIKNKISPNDKSLIVEGIFNSYANGKGIRTIMRELNTAKVPPFGKGKQNDSGFWSSSHIRRILTSRAVLGEYQPCRYVGKVRQPEGSPISDYYPAIIKKDLFYKVQNILERVLVNSATGKASKGHSCGPKGNVTNLFTKLTKCARCGSSMFIKHTPNQGGRYRYTSLICSNAMRGGGCEYHSLQYNFVERAVLSILFTKVIPAMLESDTRQDKLITLKGELKEADKQLEKWVKIVNESDTVPDRAAQQLNYYDTRKKVLTRQIESLAATIDDNPLVAWQQVDNAPENRLRLQSILAGMIDSIQIDAGNRAALLTIKEPECSFEIVWPEKAANGTKENPANLGFTCNGKPYVYVDQMLIWKSAENVKFDDVEVLLSALEKPQKLSAVMG